MSGAISLLFSWLTWVLRLLDVCFCKEWVPFFRSRAVDLFEVLTRLHEKCIGMSMSFFELRLSWSSDHAYTRICLPIILRSVSAFFLSPRPATLASSGQFYINSIWSCAIGPGILYATNPCMHMYYPFMLCVARHTMFSTHYLARRSFSRNVAICGNGGLC